MFCATPLRFPTTLDLADSGAAAPPERNFARPRKLRNKRYCEFFAAASLSYGRTVLHFLCTISSRREFSVRTYVTLSCSSSCFFFPSSSSGLVLQLSKQSDSNDSGPCATPDIIFSRIVLYFKLSIVRRIVFCRRTNFYIIEHCGNMNNSVRLKL